MQRACLIGSILCCSLMVLFPACMKRPARTSQLPSGIRGAYPFEPERISVHPLTRYWVSPSGDLEVEARIELLDRDEFPTRGVGRLELDLESQSGRRVETWVLKLDDLETNRKHFDDVTRTYLVRLSLPGNTIEQDADLVATLVLPDGDRLVASGRVNSPPEPVDSNPSQE